jgi:hypothetical protein
MTTLVQFPLSEEARTRIESELMEEEITAMTSFNVTPSQSTALTVVPKAPKTPYEPLKSMGLSTDRKKLLAMLRYMRPGGSTSELIFCTRYIMPYKPDIDAYGNMWIEVGTGSTILFSCHTDTVHRVGGKQNITYAKGVAGVANDVSSSCLGADCTTGVWLMLEMIHKNVPGRYIFHRDEECGGLGSSYVAKTEPGRLIGIHFAIAFDRKGCNEIITHQFSKRCASEAFAKSMATVLGPALNYEASDGGTFTDTANYTKIVPECTNISVGYYDQHSRLETQNVDFAIKLRDRLIVAPWSLLVAERDPTAPPEWKSWNNNNYTYYGGGNTYSHGNSHNRSPARTVIGNSETIPGTNDWYRNYRYKAPEKGGSLIQAEKKGEAASHSRGFLQSSDTGFDELQEYMDAYPEDIIAFLDAKGYTRRDLEDFIETEYGGMHFR